MSGKVTGEVRVWVAGEAELNAVAGLLAEFREHWGKSEPATKEMRESASRIMAGGDGEYLLGALGDGEPVGIAQLRFRWSVWTSAEDCWLEDLFVRESARRTGLGRALVEACCSRARDRGCKRIELDTNEDNAAALALYEACGFSTEPKGPGRTLFLGRRLD